MEWPFDQSTCPNKVGHPNLWQTFSFAEDTTCIICPVTTLRAYEERMKQFRAYLPSESKFQPFLSCIGQHTPVSSSTVARWLKAIMAEAGVDISIFKAHSVRGASYSNILDAADWSSEGTYLPKILLQRTQEICLWLCSSFIQVICKQYMLIWNWAFRCVIGKWLRARSVSACMLFIITRGRWNEISTCPTPLPLKHI